MSWTRGQLTRIAAGALTFTWWCGLAAKTAGAGTVRTTDGAVHDGTAHLTPTGDVVVRLAGGGEVRVPLGRVAQATLDAPDASTAGEARLADPVHTTAPSSTRPAQPTTAPAAVSVARPAAAGPATRPTTSPADAGPVPPAAATLPAPWRFAVVGRVDPGGTDARFDDAARAFTVAARTDDWTGTGAAAFVHQPLTGDGHVIARVDALDGNGMATAGLAIRAGLDPAAPIAVARAGHYKRIDFRYRQGFFRREARRGAGLYFPVWLRIVREGRQVSAFHSADGVAWEMLGRTEMDLPEQAYVGVLVAGGSARRGLNATAAFSHVHVLPGSGLELWSVRPDSIQAGPAGPVLRGGVVLRNGCAIAGTVRGFDGRHVDLAGPGVGVTRYPAADVARVVYSPIVPGVAFAIPPGQPGVLLRNGDFLAGTVTPTGDGRARVDSVLFGLREFALDREVAAVCLADVTPAPGAKYELTLRDGSVLMAKAVAAGRAAGTLRVDDAARGQTDVPAGQVAELRATVPAAAP